jgi:hypothetical protein
MALPVRFDRRFQLWSYSVSHSVLLLRSNRGSDHSTRIDLMFRAVVELRLRHNISDLSIGVTLDDDAKIRDLGIEDCGNRYAFLVSSRDFPNGYVVAGSLYFSEDYLLDGEPTTIDNRELADQVVRSGYYY